MPRKPARHTQPDDAVSTLEPRVSDHARRNILLAALFLIVCIELAYSNSFHTPFVYDDSTSIITNKTITHLWPPGPVLKTPYDCTTSGRPLLNLSFAINYALNGLNERGYHTVNLYLHILATLTLFGVVRRTLLQPRLVSRFGDAATPLACAVALLWGLHPVQTESVTYIVQRAESLASLFYLLTLYCFIRGTGRAESKSWQMLALICCLLGATAKEILATAPLAVLLYDRTFCAGSVAGALRRRRGLYLGLFLTWPLQTYLLSGTAARGGTVGFATAMPWQSYAVNQCSAVMLYLRLAVWPSPLIFDYGTEIVKTPVQVVLPAIALAGLLTGVAVSLRRWPAVGFAAACWFLILGPTSSVIPVVSEIIAEHRMYLPLAAPIALFVLMLVKLLHRRGLALAFFLALPLGWLTFSRNLDYQSDVRLWSDTLAKRPVNSRAENNLAIELAAAHRYPEAEALYRSSLRLQPENAAAEDNLGHLLRETGRNAESIPHFQNAIRIRPEYEIAERELGAALASAGRIREAIPHLEEAQRLDPSLAETETRLGKAYGQIGDFEKSIAHYTAAVRMNADSLTRQNLAIALSQSGRAQEASAQFRAALRLDPGNAEIHSNFGAHLGMTGHLQEASDQFRIALRISPGNAGAAKGLAAAQAKTVRQ